MLVVPELVVTPLNESNLMVELGPSREGLSLCVLYVKELTEVEG
jgi:hypothetical protein